MDANIASIVLAIIGGLTSILTLIIQRSDNKLMVKMDSKVDFIEKEKKLLKQIADAKEHRKDIIEAMIILILNTNVVTATTVTTDETIVTYKDESLRLAGEYEAINKTVSDLKKEYTMLLDLYNKSE